MLDFRYHVASLLAVFLALIVGILVGVGISGRGFVDKSEKRNFESRIAALQSRVDQLSAQKALITEEGSAEHDFVQDTYPVLMNGRLAGKRIAVIAIGASAGTAGDVRQAVTDAGAEVSLYRVLKVPIDPVRLRQALASRPGFRGLDTVGHELAVEWISQGATPISDIVSSVLVEEQRGSPGRQVDGVVVLEPTVPTDAATTLFLSGFFSGLTAAGIPVVGAEESDAQPSTVSVWSQIGGMSSVDDVDTASGRLALALVLQGGSPPGHFGAKPSAEAALPKVQAAAG